MVFKIVDFLMLLELINVVKFFRLIDVVFIFLKFWILICLSFIVILLLCNEKIYCYFKNNNILLIFIIKFIKEL